MSKRGLSLIETILIVSLLALLIGLGSSRFDSYFSRQRFNYCIRTATAVLSSARYRAIAENSLYRVETEAGSVQQKKKVDGNWVLVEKVDLERGFRVEMNAFPVFRPSGYASPLCTVTVQNDRYVCRITLSIAGRLKIGDIEVIGA